MEPKSLDQAMAALCHVSNGNFYAYAVNTLSRAFTHAVPTMSVGPDGRRYKLRVNPDFAARLDMASLMFALEHEIGHILFSHCERKWRLWLACQTPRDKMYFMIVSPLSVDCAINTLIGNKHRETALHATVILPEKFGLPQNKTFEWYHAELLKQIEDQLPDPFPVLDRTLEKVKEHLEKHDMQMPVGSIIDQLRQEMDRQREMRDEQEQEQKQDGDGDGDEQEQDGDGDEQEQNGDGDGDEQEQDGDAQEQDGEGDGEGDEQEQDGDAGNTPPRAQSPLLNAIEQQLFDHILEHLYDYLEDTTDPSTPSSLDNHMRSVMRSAKKSTKNTGRGTLPGSYQELIDKYTAPPSTPWNRVLAQHAHSHLSSKPLRGFETVSKQRTALHIWAKNELPEESPQRCAILRMPVVPGTSRTFKSNIVLVVDTSGSMGTQDLQLAASEMAHIQRAVPEITISVLYIDTEIAHSYVLDEHGTIDMNFVGRGGTDFETAFAHIATMPERPDLVVYVTDGYAPDPRTRIASPVIWCITPRGRVPMEGQPGHTHVQMKDIVG